MPTGKLIFCVDVGGTRTKAGLVDLSHRKLLVQSVSDTCTNGFLPFLDTLALRLDQLCHSAGVERALVTGCGIGLPGYVAGNWVSALWRGIAFLEGSHFLPAVEKRLGMPVRADNDARLVALGESYFGGHPASQRLLSLTLGSGLGFGLVVNGKLLEPTSVNHLSGHLPIRPVQEQCYCGFHGCLEMLTSSSGLLRAYRQARQDLSRPSDLPGSQRRSAVKPEAVFESSLKGETAARQAVNQWLQDLSAGLNAYIYLFGPDLIVLGGGLSKGLTPWLPQLQQAIFAAPYTGYQVRLVVSQIQEEAGILGAAVLFLD